MVSIVLENSYKTPYRKMRVNLIRKSYHHQPTFLPVSVIISLYQQSRVKMSDSWSNSPLDSPMETVLREKGRWTQGPGFDSVTLAAWPKPSPEFPLLFMQPWASNELRLWAPRPWPTTTLPGRPRLQCFQGQGAAIFSCSLASSASRISTTQGVANSAGVSLVWVILLYGNWAITFLIWKQSEIKVQKTEFWRPKKFGAIEFQGLSGSPCGRAFHCVGTSCPWLLEQFDNLTSRSRDRSLLEPGSNRFLN